MPRDPSLRTRFFPLKPVFRGGARIVWYGFAAGVLLGLNLYLLVVRPAPALPPIPQQSLSRELHHGAEKEAESTLELLQHVLAAPQIPQPLPTPLLALPGIADLQQDKSGAARQAEALASRYGPKHPKLLAAQTLRVEADRALKEGLNKALVVQQDKLDQLRKAPAVVREKTVQDVEKNGSPDLSTLLAGGGGAGIVLSLLWILLRDFLRSPVRSASRLEKHTGFAVLAEIPHIPAASPKDMALYPLRNPTASVANILRAWRFSLFTAVAPRHPGRGRVIAVTGAGHGAGATILAIWLARLAAKAGERVMLIDANYHAPGFQAMLPAPAGDPTFVDYLTQQKGLEEVIRRQDISGMHVILGRAVPNTAHNLLTGPRFQNVLLSLRQVYDLIVIDAPSVERGHGDLAAVASQADHVVIACRWNRTPLASVLGAVQTLGGKSLSFAVTDVE